MTLPQDLSKMNMGTMIAGNAVKDYLIALLVLIVAFVVTSVLLEVLRRSKKHAGNVTTHTLGVFLNSDRSLSILFKYIPIYMSSQFLSLPPFAESVIFKLLIILASYTVMKYIMDIVDAMTKDYNNKPNANKLMSNSMRLIAKLVIWSFGIMFVLNNMGMNITTLVAGLGVGGMALALASKEILADLFNYFIITFDRPFSIGDDVTIGSVSGVVHSIGLRGTRITSYSGEQVVVSNTDMTKGMLRNYSKMKKRRIGIKLNINYGIQARLLREIPGIVECIISSVEDAEFKSAHFFEYSDSYLTFNIYYNIDKKVSSYLDVVHEVNLKIYEEFQKRNLAFGIPNYKVQLDK